MFAVDAEKHTKEVIDIQKIRIDKSVYIDSQRDDLCQAAAT